MFLIDIEGVADGFVVGFAMNSFSRKVAIAGGAGGP
jgi:hypothetical protein